MADLAEVIPFPTNEQGDPIVPLDEPLQGEDEPLVIDDTSPNMVRDFLASEEGKKALRKISDTVMKNFEADWEASTDRRDEIAADLKMLLGDLPKKGFPFKDAARAHIPITMENMSRLVLRVESEIFGDWTNVFGVLPVGPDDEDVAEVLSAHGNWQIREKLLDFPRQMQRALIAFFVGDVTCHTYWDPVRRMNRNEVLTPEEFVTPYAYVTTFPDYSDLPHYTKIFRMYRHELQAMKDLWEGVDGVLDGRAPAFDDDPEEPLRDAVAEVYGEEKPDGSEAPYKMLWYEGWFELPGEEKDRFCKVILDHGTKAVLLLTVLEEPNWEDKIRFERQSAQMDEYKAQMIAFQQAQAAIAQKDAMFAEAAMQSMATGMPMDPGQMAQMDPEYQALLGQTAQAPIPPEWLLDPEDLDAEPEPVRMEPVHMFAHGACFESLAGSLGLGYLKILADYNRAADTMASQYIDAATLANASSWITDESVEFESPFELGPGKINKASGVSGNISDHIMPVATRPASEQLMQSVDRMQNYASAAVQAPDILSGEPGKSGETYRGLSARLEQAMKPISVVARKFCVSFLRQVLRNNARLNSVYLSDDEIFHVLNHQTGKYDVLMAGKNLYQRDYRVEIRADLRFAPQAQRIAEADELVQLPAAVPPMQGNFAFIQAALRKAFQARGRADMEPYLGPPAEPPATPLGLPPQAFPPGSKYGPPLPPPGMMPPPGAPGQPSGGPPPGPPPSPGAGGPPGTSPSPPPPGPSG